MIRAYDENGNVVDMVAWENEIYNKALDDFRKRINDFLIDSYYFVDFVVKDGAIDGVIDELKKGTE